MDCQASQTLSGFEIHCTAPDSYHGKVSAIIVFLVLILAVHLSKTFRRLRRAFRRRHVDLEMGLIEPSGTIDVSL